MTSGVLTLRFPVQMRSVSLNSTAIVLQSARRVGANDGG
jgi:hypothetical protein